MYFPRCFSSGSAKESPATPLSIAEFSQLHSIHKSQQEEENVPYPEKHFHKKQMMNTDDMAADEKEEAAVMCWPVGEEGGGDGGAAFSLSPQLLHSTCNSQEYPRTQTRRSSQSSTPTIKKLPDDANEEHKEIGGMIPKKTDITEDGVMAQCSKRMCLDGSINEEKNFPSSSFSLPISTAAYISNCSSSSSDSNCRDTSFYTAANGRPSSSSSWIPPTSAVLVSIPTDFCTAGGRPICVKQWRAVSAGAPLSSTVSAVSPKYRTMNSSDIAFESLSMRSKNEEVSRSKQDEVTMGATDSSLNDNRDAEVRRRQELEETIDLDLLAQWKKLSRCVTAADSALGCQAVYEVMSRRDESVGNEK